jgi:transposase
MTDHTPSSRVSRLEVISTGARRRWTLAEKQRIVAESQAGRRQVSATARRYSLSVSQLFTWCRLAREGRLFEGDEATTFAPVLISSAPSTSSLPSLSGRIEIVLRCGRRVIVDNGVDSAALARVLAVLERP